MDDPVTHFDDLNTYAFLDLIVGLLESDVGKRQFIISTCDEKLLQLARQKFRHLGENAVFYRFDAIGPEGPVVEKISLLLNAATENPALMRVLHIGRGH
jgi:DNA repair protein SbcC/Rad50